MHGHHSHVVLLVTVSTSDVGGRKASALTMLCGWGHWAWLETLRPVLCPRTFMPSVPLYPAVALFELPPVDTQRLSAPIPVRRSGKLAQVL